MKNYNNFCKNKNCKDYIEWEYWNHASADYDGPFYCTSCKKVGQSYNIEEYAKDCPHIADLKVYNGS